MESAGQTGLTWYALVEGEQLGPFDLARLRILVQKGELAEETLLWREGMAEPIRLVDIVPTVRRATVSGIVPVPGEEELEDAEKTRCAFCEDYFPEQSMDASYDAPACPRCRSALNMARSLAFVLDGGGGFLIGGFVAFMLTFLLALAWKGDMGYTAAFRGASVIGILVGYLSVLPLLLTKDAWFDGRSPGKVVMGISVVEQRTARTVDWRGSARRNWPLVVPLLALWLAWQVWFGDGARLGDGGAGTKVIFTRSRRRDLREKQKSKTLPKPSPAARGISR